MTKIAIGVDVSKGYADIQLINQAGTVLGRAERYDDTAEGHERVRSLVYGLKERCSESEFVIGLEASGGLERNWLKFFRGLKSICSIEVLHLNPLAVRRYHERNLKRNKTDQTSAGNIAEYLMWGRRRQEVEYEPELEGSRALYRLIKNITGQRVQLQTRLQGLLSVTHPDLVQFCRDGLADWILELLIAYPTADQLRRAKPSSLQKIHRISEKRAVKLIGDAQKSVASQVDKQTGITVEFLAREIRQHNQKAHNLTQKLLESLKGDESVKIISSVKGIGLWTAVILRLEYGSIERFYSSDSVVAYAGLDPRIDQSGDIRRDIGISRAGRSQIREALYMPTRAAVRFNPVIRAFYLHLLAKGKQEKVALVACMAKLLRITYACWITGKTFDADYSKAVSKPAMATLPYKNSETPSLSAPISRKEARKRKAAASPQKGIKPLLRGPGAASTINHSTSENA